MDVSLPYYRFLFSYTYASDVTGSDYGGCQNPLGFRVRVYSASESEFTGFQSQSLPCLWNTSNADENPAVSSNTKRGREKGYVGVLS